MIITELMTQHKCPIKKNQKQKLESFQPMEMIKEDDVDVNKLRPRKKPENKKSTSEVQ